jgi:hypothetical protein
MNEVAGSAAPPGHVTRVVTVTQRGKPVTTLQPSAFRIQEDGQSLDGKAAELRLLAPDDVIAFHTVLLIDLGPGANQEGRTVLAESAKRFVQELRKRQSVTVMAFDGSSNIRLIGDFPRGVGAGKPNITARHFSAPRNPARNLRGAVLEGLKRLDTKLSQSVKPVRVGALVVFSEGPDLANRVPEATLTAQLEKSRREVYWVGVQGQGSAVSAPGLSRSGKALASDLAHLPEAFESLTQLVSTNMDGYYVLSYCSQARSGSPKVHLEVDVVSDELEVETGAIESQFSAAGFSGGCKATKPRSSLVNATAKN